MRVYREQPGVSGNQPDKGKASLGQLGLDLSGGGHSHRSLSIPVIMRDVQCSGRAMSGHDSWHEWVKLGGSSSGWRSLGLYRPGGDITGSGTQSWLKWKDCQETAFSRLSGKGKDLCRLWTTLEVSVKRSGWHV